MDRVSPRTRNTILIALGSVVLLGACVWAYYAFTTVPPPVLTKATPEQVSSYLGNPQGFSRLSVPKREEFLVNTYNQFGSPEGWEKLNRALGSMSMQERQVFADATFDVARMRVLETAKEFNRTPQAQRQQFVDSAIANFRTMQSNLGGRGNPNQNVGEAFKPLAPERSEDWNKVLFSKTSARDRAQAEPLVDAIAKRIKEQRAQEGKGPIRH